MKTRNESLENGLRSIDPLDAEEMDRLSSRAGEMLASIQVSDWEPAAAPPGAPRARTPRRLLVAIPVAAVAAVLALVIGVPGGGGGGEGTLPALAQVAQAAASQTPPDTSLPYLYVKTREEVVNGTAANGEYWSDSQDLVHEQWIAADGSGRVRTFYAPPRFVAPADREAWEAADRIPFLAHGWGSYTQEDDLPAGHFSDSLYDGKKLSALPTDPAELAGWLEDRVGAEPGGGNGFSLAVKTLTLTAELLNNPLASPELRAALYEAEGLIEGIEYLGEATDEIGRHGVAVGAESANSGQPTLYSLIFDPDTSQVLAYEQTPLVALGGPRDREVPVNAKLFIDSGRTSTLGGDR